MSDQGIDRPREIRGPEDVEALLAGEIFSTLHPTWQRVFGEALVLAMDAATDCEGADRFGLTISEEEKARDAVKAWRSLSDKLKGLSERVEIQLTK